MIWLIVVADMAPVFFFVIKILKNDGCTYVGTGDTVSVPIPPRGVQ